MFKKYEWVMIFTLIGILICSAIVMGRYDAKHRAKYEPGRFEVQNIRQSNESCGLEILTDRYTGCQYLMVCSSVTSMPGTCKTVSVNELRKEVTK